jgi:hypothetical protein
MRVIAAKDFWLETPRIAAGRRMRSVSMPQRSTREQASSSIDPRQQLTALRPPSPVCSPLPGCRGATLAALRDGGASDVEQR